MIKKINLTKMKFLIAFTRPYMTFTRHAREGDKTLPGIVLSPGLACLVKVI